MMYGLSGFGWAELGSNSGRDGQASGYSEDELPAVTILAPDHSPCCPECGADIDVQPHETDCPWDDWTPDTSIASAFNHAGVEIREDSVDVHISIGDPRGAFVMRIERLSDGELRLSVPTPDDSLLHCQLTQLGSPGYYRIGG